MPRHIIKPVRDRDFYIEWSSVVDCPVDWGTREEFREVGYGDFAFSQADLLGTSSYHSGDGEWRQKIFEVRIEQHPARRNRLYSVLRENLEGLCKAWESGDVTPFLHDRRKKRQIK